MNSTPNIVLADGTVLEDSECGYADYTLWCYVKGKTISEVFELFIDPKKTSHISYVHNGNHDDYEGFTKLNLIKQSEFTVDVRMVKENTNI